MKILYSEVFKAHRAEAYHPENPKRLELAVEALKTRGLWENPEEPPEAEVKEILKVHSPEYVEEIRQLSERGVTYIDPDTYVSKGTWKAALKAFGAALQAAKLAIKEKDFYLALVRPPGHHAGRSGKAFSAPTLGFCIFNNAARAASLLKEKLGRAIIIDFDVHHGNGTQEIFWKDGSVIHIDIHEDGIYPGSGRVYDVGGEGAEGSKINIPMPHYSKDDDYIFAWREVVIPILENIEPKVVVVSAGFDAFKDDGLATMELTEKFYYFAGASLSKFSLVVVLEGGYGVGLKRGLPAFTSGYLAGKADIEKIFPSERVIEKIKEVKEVQSSWWEL